MSRALASFCVFLIASSATACAPGVPGNPTWAEDVAPILAANCVRCHTVPAIGGAPDGFRLDTFEDWQADDGTMVRGAGTMASDGLISDYVRTRIAPDNDDVPQMPPEEGFASLSDRQVDVLLAWMDNVDADTRPVRGAARDGNSAPEMTIIDQLVQQDGTLVIDYQITDADNEIVVGELVVGDDIDTGTIVSRELHSGRGQVVWDIAAFPDGNYTIFGALRDPSGSHEINLGTRELTPGDVAPAVAVQNLRRDSLIGIAEGTDFDLQVAVADLDTADADLTLTLQARLGETVIDIPVGAMVAGVNTITWDLTNVPAGDAWRLDVTVSDQTSTRTLEIGPFIVAKGTTTETFDSINTNILSAYCNFCHNGGNPATPTVPGLTHDFSVYGNQGTAPDVVLGARELAGLIYRRAIQQQNMPPVSYLAPSGLTIPAQDLARLTEWLLAGAPEGAAQ